MKLNTLTEVRGEAAAQGARAPLLLLLHAGLGHRDARPPGRGQAEAHRGLRVTAAHGQEVGPGKKFDVNKNKND